MTLLITLVTAHAAPTTTTICAKYRVGLLDVNEELTYLDDDFFLDNDDKPARGARLKVYNNDTFTTSWYWLDDDSQEVSGSQVSCVDVELNDVWDYDIKLYSRARVGGNEVEVLDTVTNPGTFYHHAETSWTPFNGTKIITTSSADHWNIAAAAGWALHRRSAGLSQETFSFYMEACPYSATASCQVGSVLFMHPNSWANKSVVVHELGHAIAEASNGWNDENLDGGATHSAHCDHGIIEKEHASNAANEGIAWYYVAVVFNRPTESDCEIAREADYDGDGIVGECLQGECTPSCEGFLFEGWAYADYLGVECGGVIDDRGTALDWMRAMWDATQGYGVTTPQIFAMWDAANPHTWDGDGGSTSDDPKERMEAAAAAVGVSSGWNAVDDVNGLR